MYFPLVIANKQSSLGMSQLPLSCLAVVTQAIDAAHGASCFVHKQIGCWSWKLQAPTTRRHRGERAPSVWARLASGVGRFSPARFAAAAFCGAAGLALPPSCCFLRALLSASFLLCSCRSNKGCLSNFSTWPPAGVPECQGPLRKATCCLEHPVPLRPQHTRTGSSCLVVSDIDSWPAEVEDLTTEEAPAGKGTCIGSQQVCAETIWLENLSPGPTGRAALLMCPSSLSVASDGSCSEFLVTGSQRETKQAFRRTASRTSYAPKRTRPFRSPYVTRFCEKMVIAPGQVGSRIVT